MMSTAARDSTARNCGLTIFHRSRSLNGCCDKKRVTASWLSSDSKRDKFVAVAAPNDDSK
jgi:hypothetical protein